MSTHAITRDAECAAMLREQHAGLVADLEALVDRLAGAPDRASCAAAQSELVAWTRTQLGPHAAGDEATLYRAAYRSRSGRLLVDALLSQHRVILGLVDEVEAARDRCSATAWAGALLLVVVEHVGTEDDLLLPMLLADPTIDLASVQYELHRVAG